MASERLRVHVLSQAFPNLIDQLRSRLPDIEFVRISSPGREGIDGQTFADILQTRITPEVAGAVKDAEYIIIDAHLLGQAMYDMPKAKWAHLTWAGVERLLAFVKEEEENPKFPVCRFSGIHFGQQMAEYAVWAVVGFERDLFRTVQRQQDSVWLRDGRLLHQRFIRDLTVGIMGVGLIGSHVAKTFKSFGGKTIGLGLHEKKPEEVDYLDGYWTFDQLDDFLQQCDVLIGILPSTPATIGLLNDGRLSKCTKRPLLMNMGRGTLINDAEIIRAIDNKWISGAVLDVFFPEPLPKSSPLWKHPQVHITPHISGISREQDIAEQAAANLRDFLAGKEPVGVVHWDAGY